jgi:hypothetical protein
MSDLRADARNPYHETGVGVLFCRVCLVSFVPSRPSSNDPRGVELHEAANLYRHKRNLRALNNYLDLDLDRRTP